MTTSSRTIAALASTAILLALVGVALAGCGLGGPAHDAAPPGVATVDMGFGGFEPASIHVKAGQPVEFRNRAVIVDPAS